MTSTHRLPVLAGAIAAAAGLAAALTVGPAPTASADLIGFTSPSGNIGCIMDSSHARCDIRERDWRPPATPPDCPFGYGQGIVLYPGEAAQFVCAGDTALDGGAPLAFGNSAGVGDFRCDSSPSGMRCTNIQTGQAFSISREGYRLS